MATFAHTVEIARPVEEVFAFVSEPANLPRWQRSLLDVRPHRRGPLQCGLEVTERRRFLGRELELATNTLRLKHLLEENRA